MINKYHSVEAATCNKYPHDGSINHSDEVLNDNTYYYSYRTVISELL